MSAAASSPIGAATQAPTTSESFGEATIVAGGSGRGNAATMPEMDRTLASIGGATADTAFPTTPATPARGPVSPSSRAGDASGPLGTGQAFGSRYLVIKVLGIGGMGAVYQVWDAELGHAVALKVIRPEAASDPADAREMERRFKQELLLARQVTHKNVVRIHDLGEIDGVKYITMPYLDGSDLASALKSEGKLPVPAALRIVRDVVAGLAAAHEAGIVHRDLKPANIMLVGDQAIIMDFGIARPSVPSATARAAERSARSADGRSTDTPPLGGVEGTVEYMAPEQAKGEEVDQRADLYALGLIFSDMLLGRRPRSGKSVLEQLKQRIEEVPPPVRTADPTIPEAVERIITRCLALDPAERFQTSAELIAELNRLDDKGKPLPIHRVIGVKGMAAAAVVFLALLAGTWWFASGLAAPVQHDPVSVLIADFENNTGDPDFDRTLEPMLKLALETAGFITAYSHADVGRSLGVSPPDRFDTAAARQLAVQQGLGVVVSGALQRQGNRYVVSVKASQAVTDELIVDRSRNATNKDQVLGVATNLVSDVREALGDVSDSAKRFATETLSAVSLDVVRDYTGAMDALSRSRFEEALKGFGNAAQRDPTFGLAYAGLAITARNLDRQADAERYAKEAITRLDGMTERERYRARGIYYYVTGDYEECAREYSDLVARFAADVAARNNLALCMTYLRNMRGALDEMRQVVKILPNRALYRENLALYASYSSDFQAGEDEARAIAEPGPFGLLALAFAQLGRGQPAAAATTYQTIGSIDALGASYMASGLGDIALYSGRFAEAERILAAGAAADLKGQDASRAAAKLAWIAHARMARGRGASAIEAAETALTHSQAVKIRFMAARVFVEAEAFDRAEALARDLARELQAEPQAYGRIIDGAIALKRGDPRLAIKLLLEANTLLDTWIGHFDLGRAYLEAGTPLQADSEFDRCIGRRGEVMSLFLDEEPTYGYLPPVYYYQGRVREELRTSGYADSYRTYLAIRGQSTEDPLVADVRQRLPAN